MNLIEYSIIPTEEIILNEYETANRLKVSKGFTSAEIEKNLERLKDVVNGRFSATRVLIKRPKEDTLDLGFGEFKSKILAKNLKDSREAFVFAVTLGMGVDRLLTKLSKTSTAEYFITDALASAMAEALMDEAERRVKGEILTRPRFSPGFGDFTIEIQPRILSLLNAQKLLGITVNDSFLMSPVKSVTAVMGIV